MNHTTHENHNHVHGANCGHPAVPHGDHTDYLHDGHMHSPHGDHYDEHVIEVSAMNPENCAPTACNCGHDGCVHAAAPHGDHLDYVSDGRLHHRHGDHCDDHGAMAW